MSRIRPWTNGDQVPLEGLKVPVVLYDASGNPLVLDGSGRVVTAAQLYDSAGTPIVLDGSGRVITASQLYDAAGEALTSTVNDDRTTNLDGLRGLNVNGVMYGRVSDTVVKSSRLDASTEALITVSYEHHELHDGTHFTYTQGDSDWDTGEQVRILITTPDSLAYTHFVFDFSAALDTTVDFYEDATHTASTALTAYNNNRVVGTAPNTVLNVALSDGANGTNIYTSPFGINTGGGSNRISGGGEARGTREWILKPNSKYLFLASTGTSNSSYNLKFSFYEHTDRN